MTFYNSKQRTIPEENILEIGIKKEEGVVFQVKHLIGCHLIILYGMLATEIASKTGKKPKTVQTQIYRQAMLKKNT